MVSQEDSVQRYGTSSTILDYVLRHQLAEIKPKEIVDFGAGGGKNGSLVRDLLGNDCRLIAVEGYEKTARMLGEQGIYDEVHHKLLQEWLEGNSQRKDLAIFGDVLEHLPRNEIYRALDTSLKSFAHVIVVAPLHELFQGELYGNMLEVHRTYITSRFFDRYNPIEKHIAPVSNWTFMNVRISANMRKRSLRRRFFEAGYHYSVLALQPVGMARPFHKFADCIFQRFQFLFGD